MIITKPYNTYFQKSKVFTFPLLGITKKAIYTPEMTYLSWEGYYEPSDYRLICLYRKGNDIKKWERFRNSVILRNPFYENCLEPSSESYAVVVFNLKARFEAYQWIAIGRYSQIHPDLKNLILMFHGVNTGEHAYVDSFLNPGKHTQLYSQLYNVSEDLLIRVGELCDKPNLEKERLRIEVKDEIVIPREMQKS